MQALLTLQVEFKPQTLRSPNPNLVLLSAQVAHHIQKASVRRAPAYLIWNRKPFVSNSRISRDVMSVVVFGFNVFFLPGILIRIRKKYYLSWSELRHFWSTINIQNILLGLRNNKEDMIQDYFCISFSSCNNLTSIANDDPGDRVYSLTRSAYEFWRVLCFWAGITMFHPKKPNPKPYMNTFQNWTPHEEILDCSPKPQRRLCSPRWQVFSQRDPQATSRIQG